MAKIELSPDEVSALSSVWPGMGGAGCIYVGGYLIVPDEHLATAEGYLPGLAEAALTEAKVRARSLIIARADAITAPIMSRYPEAERAGWDKREAEARAIIAASNKAQAVAATTIIKALAAAAGEDTAATVARAETIAAKADEFAAISVAVEIMRDQALEAIDVVSAAEDMPATLEELNDQANMLAAQYGLAQ
ncbi:hypothetical protein [Hoeflea sp.]|uniref:hypothetical protein n=1 Tax=Hoeflea sp. TaxID=1940281 RepID=UPI003A8D6C95